MKRVTALDVGILILDLLACACIGLGLNLVIDASFWRIVAATFLVAWGAKSAAAAETLKEQKKALRRDAA